MIRRLIAPLLMAVVAFHAGQALAQGAFPAPLPGKVGTVNDPAFPPVNGAAPPPSGAFGNAPPPPGAFGNAPAQASFPGAASSPFAAPPTQGGADDCMKNFLPLRQEAEKRGHLLKVAGEKKVSADEACKLITSFIQAEVKMIKYVEVNSAKCGIPPQIHDQLKKGHDASEGMKSRICGAAAQMKNAPQGPVGPSLSEVLGSAAQLPEATTAKKSGGTTFDTLSGNALAR
ncbi:MAG TPA: hypothetical protein VFL62_25965 [Bradyrhizobium sp.]|uniref:hypothetical protein n=1 Tax=Bradyrhizobium sp. TaxID=376 RepID=UPI002D7ED3D1|nr:hypothetical protein [Bradyrhizobium sp.]HET7889692.1 hypothetical protein [Bradyrhizobium sp.]